MDVLKRDIFGGFDIIYRQGLVDPSAIVNQFAHPYGTIKKGRGEIKILSVGDNLLACRKYIHGGLLRGITGDAFCGERRAAAELETMMFLEENNFPVVRPCGYIIKRTSCAKELHLLTFFEENAIDFIDFLKSAQKKERYQTIINLARLFFEMGKLGVYHPDFHLQNVLVTKQGSLLFLDFDRAYRKTMTKKDMERILWRLNRFTEKKANCGGLTVNAKEKMLFLRTIERLSGHHLIEDMQRQLKSKRRVYRLGWFLDSLFYRKNRNTTQFPSP